MKNLILIIKTPEQNQYTNAQLKMTKDAFEQMLDKDTNLLILTDKTADTALYWLEGKNNQEDIKTLEEIKDKLTPVLNTKLNAQMGIIKLDNLQPKKKLII